MDIHKCTCGFEWIHGQSGAHSCSPYHMKTIGELKDLLEDIKKDLLLRGETDMEDGGTIVDLSSSIWHRIKEETT